MAAAWEVTAPSVASGGLSVAALSSAPGSLAAASAVVGWCSFLALVGGPLVALASFPTSSGGLTVAKVSEVSGSLAFAAAVVVVGGCVLLALVGGPSAPLAAFLWLAAVWPPLRIMAALPRV